jgi:hypothetical protein
VTNGRLDEQIDRQTECRVLVISCCLAEIKDLSKKTTVWIFDSYETSALNGVTYWNTEFFKVSAVITPNLTDGRKNGWLDR